MTIVAGIDIGNATTEIVLVDPARPGVVVDHASARTRAAKGSSTSIRGAADLLRRLQRRGHHVDEVAVSSLRPVTTSTTHVPGERPPSGPIALVVQGSSTPANPGFGAGRAVLVTDTVVERGVDGTGAVVAVVPRAVGFDRAARFVRRVVRSGVDVRAVVLEADEAVLLANRIHARIPVVDEVDLTGADEWRSVAVEVVARGGVLTHLVDPLRLSAVFDVAADDPAVASVVSRVGDVSSAVVAAVPSGGRVSDPTDQTPGEAMAATTVMAALRSFEAAGHVGPATVRGPDGTVRTFDDLHGVDVHALVGRTHCHVLDVSLGAHAIAMLGSESPMDPAAELAGLIDVPVRLVATETAAARVGALTTPGMSPNGTVIDLGAGTIDVIGESGTRVLAGAGDLTTQTIAVAASIPSGLAEWVKRGPAVWVDGPFRTIAENGDRAFLDQPAPASHVGRLVVEGPTGSLPFQTPLHVSQWRALRLAAKEASAGRGVGRARELLPTSGTAVVVGGPALDPEILMAVRSHLPGRLMLGRGDVAGSLGPRYAVAYGLARLLVAT